MNRSRLIIPLLPLVCVWSVLTAEASYARDPTGIRRIAVVAPGFRADSSIK